MVLIPDTHRGIRGTVPLQEAIGRIILDVNQVVDSTKTNLQETDYVSPVEGMDTSPEDVPTLGLEIIVKIL